MKKLQFSKDGKVRVGLFQSEIRDGFVFTIENSKDPSQEYTINSKHILDKYNLVSWEKNNKVFMKYEIAIEDLIKIEKEDNNINQMTIRDFYCIIHQVPQSMKGWLNNLIRNGYSSSETESKS